LATKAATTPCDATPKPGAANTPARRRAPTFRCRLRRAKPADQVASPQTETQTVEQLKAAPRRKPDDGVAAMPPEVQEELVHEVLDNNYRASLDKPTPMLGDVSPRAVPRIARGRKDLVVWLKHPENRSRHTRDRNDPMATYDFTWMWRELNVEHLRN
jgi:hypothetical protein